MEIRKYAKTCGHEIVGKLTRWIERERELAGDYGRNFRCYRDEAGVSYYQDEYGIDILTACGAVL